MEQLKQEVKVLIRASILLDDHMKVVLEGQIDQNNNRDKLRGMLVFLQQEKNFIINFLRKVIQIDTSGLTVLKLRQYMQQAYIGDIREQESAQEEVDKAEIESTLAELDY